MAIDQRARELVLRVGDLPAIALEGPLAGLAFPQLLALGYEPLDALEQRLDCCGLHHPGHVRRRSHESVVKKRKVCVKKMKGLRAERTRRLG